MTEQAKIYSEFNDLVALRFQTQLRKLAHQQKLLAASSGEHHAVRKGRGMTFSEVRQYQPGDEIRHIDWKVTARTQKAHTKVFIEERERPTLIITEQTPSLFFGAKVRLKTSQALNIAATLAWVSLQQNERVGGLVFGAETQSGLHPKRSKHSVLRYLQAGINMQQQLQRPARASASRWHDALQATQELIRPGSKVYLIGDMTLLAQHSIDKVKQLARHNDLVAIHIFDEIEQHLPELGWLMMADSLESTPIRFDSSRRETQMAYQQIYQQQWQNAQMAFRSLHIPLVAIDNQQDPIQQLLQQGVLR